jgi:hypothetical protein
MITGQDGKTRGDDGWYHFVGKREFILMSRLSSEVQLA